MLQLRLNQQAVGEGRHQVDLNLEGDGAPRAATATFAFGLSSQDEEDLRWYLEDFLQYPQEPAPKIARRIEGRLAEVGTELFKAVFQANDDARRIWSRVEERLPETRIEIVSGVTEAATIPWELLREPSTTSALALTAHSFVRAQPNTARAPQLPARKKGKIRILLVICRPRGAVGERDVPFRSVASQLLRGLSKANARPTTWTFCVPLRSSNSGRCSAGRIGRVSPTTLSISTATATIWRLRNPRRLGLS
jgi:hypothetical protein